jgi:TPR repeat protein
MLTFFSAQAASCLEIATNLDLFPSPVKEGALDLHKTISLQGEITQGDAQQFLIALRRVEEEAQRFRHRLTKDSNALTIVYLSSTGGSVAEGFALAEVINSISDDGSVIVAVRDVCASACTIVLFSSVSRYARTCDLIGVHRASINGEETPQSVQVTLAISQYLREVGVPEEILNKMLRTEASRMAWLTTKDLALAGLSVLQDPCGKPISERSFAFIAAAANSGDPEAKYEMARRMLDESAAGDTKEVVFLLTREAAEAGIIDAQFLLGVLYSSGYGVEHSAEAAVQWYIAAAQKNHADAQYNLGHAFQNGVGVAINYEEAVYWFRKAAKAGKNDAALNLGSIYADGTSPHYSVARAIMWYAVCSYQGNEQCNGAAQYLAGIAEQEDLTTSERLFVECIETKLTVCDEVK